MVREKVLVTGGSGLLGSNAAQVTTKDFEVFATYNRHPSESLACKLVPLDIRDRQHVISVFEEVKPDLVIHTAAMVNVDYCEDHAEEAWITNVEGTQNVALATKQVGAKMIYMSTDSVFDGKKGMYTEEDVPCPVNTYATTKLEGERRVQYWLPDSSIIRAAFYGWSPTRSIKTSLAEWIVSGLRDRRPITMFTDVFFSPIVVNSLVAVMIEMYRKGLSGIYHVGGRERCSKYAFGQAIARVFGLDIGLIQPSTPHESGLRAPRPTDISLNPAKVSALVDTRLPDVKEGVTRFRGLEYGLRRGQG